MSPRIINFDHLQCDPIWYDFHGIYSYRVLLISDLFPYRVLLISDLNVSNAYPRSPRIINVPSSKTFLNYIVSGEIFNDFGSLNDQEKMQLSNNFFAVLTNFIYPIVIYATNKKLRKHVLECLNLK